jgi:hypothetical protein
MKRLLILLGSLLLAAAAQATSFTAKLSTLTGGAPNAFIKLELKNCGNFIPQVSGSDLRVPKTAYLFPDASGNVSATVVDQATITCGTSLGVAYYAITIVQGDAATPERARAISPTVEYDVTGGSFNLNTATPRSGGTVAPGVSVYDTVQDEGAPLTQRSKINFIGAPVSAADNLGGLRSDVTIRALNPPSIVILAPAAADTNKIQHKFPVAGTLQRVSCSTDQGTVDLQLDKRAEATPNSAGSNVLSGTLQCVTTTAVTGAGGAPTISSGALTANQVLNLQILATAGSPGVVRIHFDFRSD